MKVVTAQWTAARGWVVPRLPAAYEPDWILYFGAVAQLENPAGPVQELRVRFPRAVCCGCSTSGELLEGHISDDTAVAALVKFSGVRVRAVKSHQTSPTASRSAGRDAAEQLRAPDLRHVLVLSDGLLVNGTQLVAGFSDALGHDVTVTGGLAADGTRFGHTLTGLDAEIRSGQVVAVGFYGSGLRIGCGQAGGWVSFGPRRLITRSKNNVLYELDGVPALDLYKKYLGDRAAGLPATGLLFPLEVLPDASDQTGLVRTILAVDEGAHSLTFAGDMPEGYYARLMKASHAGLVAGAGKAAERVVPEAVQATGDRLAVLVSCVGRRLVLGQHTEEELDAVCRVLPDACRTIGFYSYGEICPLAACQRSELHNQTMTVTTIAEDA